MISVELPAVSSHSFCIDCNVALPIDDRFNASFIVISDGVGDSGDNDFAVAIHLAAVNRVLGNKPRPQPGYLGNAQSSHNRSCEFVSGDAFASSIRRRNGQLRHELQGAGLERIDAVLSFAV